MKCLCGVFIIGLKDYRCWFSRVKTLGKDNMNKFNFFKKFLENPLSKTIESRWVGRKVSNINEFRDYLNGGIKWHGELDNGHYFLIFVHEGIVNISISEREMMLPFELERLVATHESLDEYINCKDVNERLALGVGLRLNAPT